MFSSANVGPVLIAFTRTELLCDENSLLSGAFSARDVRYTLIDVAASSNY
jgi:hypothetical protein